MDNTLTLNRNATVSSLRWFVTLGKLLAVAVLPNAIATYLILFGEHAVNQVIGRAVALGNAVLS